MTPEQFAKTGSEYAHQVSVFIWAALHINKYPQLKWLHAIKNEEKSGSAIVGAKFKASGVKSGVSDLFLPALASCSSGLFIEMKKPGGRPSIDQLEFGCDMVDEGYAFIVCDTWESATKAIVEYLENKWTQFDYRPMLEKMKSKKKVVDKVF